MTWPDSTRWHIDHASGGIVWNVADAGNPANTLPHSDHVEMSGGRVSVIVRYRIDAQRRLFVERDIFFPQMRVRENDVRGYLRRIYDDRLILPRFRIGGEEWFPDRAPIERVTFDGILTFHYAATPAKMRVERRLYPSRFAAAVWEEWWFQNDSRHSVEVQNLPRSLRQEDTMTGGTVVIESFPTVSGSGDFTGTIAARDCGSFESYVRAYAPEENPLLWSYDEHFERMAFASTIQTWSTHIEFACPDPELNRLFAFCKLRAAESLFETDVMGLVHSPGGGNYYGGIWANDQCEYSGPFFAYLNHGAANMAAVNAYRHYAKHMGPDYAPVPTSFEMGGHIPYHAGGDRGDAAMIASGLSRYLLVRGDRDLAAELYPMLRWCNEYIRRKTDSRGVVLSDTDELEGRFSTGDANLSTATLAYDGYRMSACVARDLGHSSEAAEWSGRADALAVAIESHFGAAVEGFDTYRYHDGNEVLRSWICLPLVFGIAQGARQSGTLDALFSPRLWTADGLATQAGETTFWDRSTLYGLRGAFFAGATEPAYEHLLSYSRRRLLGDHVPYPVEAYPENAQAHLSAESALYCRVFLEGVLGIVPTGFDSFTLTPRLPVAWDEYRLRFTAFGGRDMTIHVKRDNHLIAVTVSSAGGAIYYSGSEDDGRALTVRLNTGD